jgi:hypothetical protein
MPAYIALKVLAAVLVAITMGLALAHALELPGKMRLSKEQYRTVQPIYYPGFTIGGGIAEVGSIVTTLVLLLVTPSGTRQFWLIAGALAAVLVTHVVFWVMTQPVNRFWLEKTELTASAKSFFRTERTDRAEPEPTPDWTVLRDRWELSHVLRAIAALLGLILLITAAAL